MKMILASVIIVSAVTIWFGLITIDSLKESNPIDTLAVVNKFSKDHYDGEINISKEVIFREIIGAEKDSFKIIIDSLEAQFDRDVKSGKIKVDSNGSLLYYDKDDIEKPMVTIGKMHYDSIK